MIIGIIILLHKTLFSALTQKKLLIASYLEKIRKSGLSIGAVIEVRAENVPVGLGDPIYDKLDSKIAQALMSINAVKE